MRRSRRRQRTRRRSQGEWLIPICSSRKQTAQGPAPAADAPPDQDLPPGYFRAAGDPIEEEAPRAEILWSIGHGAMGTIPWPGRCRAFGQRAQPGQARSAARLSAAPNRRARRAMFVKPRCGAAGRRARSRCCWSAFSSSSLGACPRRTMSGRRASGQSDHLPRPPRPRDHARRRAERAAGRSRIAAPLCAASVHRDRRPALLSNISASTSAAYARAASQNIRCRPRGAGRLDDHAAAGEEPVPDQRAHLPAQAAGSGARALAGEPVHQGANSGALSDAASISAPAPTASKRRPNAISTSPRAT